MSHKFIQDHSKMKHVLKYFFLPLCIFFAVITFSSFISDDPAGLKFPYKKAGLTERQAAAHLLSRFTYGARPGDVDEVMKVGLEKWFLQQLSGALRDDSLENRLSNYDAIRLSNNEVMRIFPKNAQVLRMAIRDGIIPKDSVNAGDKKTYRAQLQDYMQKNGFKPQAELFRQLINQKILRASYSNNQLKELLTDFWFNHFNVSITKNSCAELIPAYERDVIRPNVSGRFEDLLLATAKSPAMLMYLDNFSSSGVAENLPQPVNSQMRQRLAASMRMIKDTSSFQAKALQKMQQNRKNQGLNENYAREVMELHTLGVEGGYTQADVTQAARVLTGWTVYPMDNGYGSAIKNMLERAGEENLKKRGFVHENDFLFAANRHDREEKTVLGKRYSSNGGYEEGIELLKMLAHHPSTAKFISGKIAVRFVSDSPPKQLVDRMAATFTEKGGNISEVLLTMVSSPEFWSKEALREKTKSPFELAISAVRSLNADIRQPFQLNIWINKMGQKMYFYQAPTGFPDKGQYWINTGSLLNRMNFGLALASQRIPGIRINLLALNKNREPESSEAALISYSNLIMPERDLAQTITRLSPMLNDPLLNKKIEEAASKNASPEPKQNMVNEDARVLNEDSDKAGNKIAAKSSNRAMQSLAGNNSMLSQVVGVILGSPEFQRR